MGKKSAESTAPALPPAVWFANGYVQQIRSSSSALTSLLLSGSVEFENGTPVLRLADANVALNYCPVTGQKIEVITEAPAVVTEAAPPPAASNSQPKAAAKAAAAPKAGTKKAAPPPPAEEEAAEEDFEFHEEDEQPPEEEAAAEEEEAEEEAQEEGDAGDGEVVDEETSEEEDEVIDLEKLDKPALLKLAKDYPSAKVTSKMIVEDIRAAILTAANEEPVEEEATA